MSPVELLRELSARGIRVVVRGDRLSLRGLALEDDRVQRVVADGKALVHAEIDDILHPAALDMGLPPISCVVGRF